MATEVDNVNSGALGTLLAVGACATLGIALVVTALVRTEVSEEAEKKEMGADRSYRDLVAEQTAKMAAPAAYVDRANGLVSLPIDRAMELTVSGLIKDPNSATPVAAAGGSGGAGGAASAQTGGAAAGGSGGSGGAGGSAGAPVGGAKPVDEATHAEPGEHGEKVKPTPAGAKDISKPKPATPGVPGVPGLPAPVTTSPAAPAAPAAPAPNGQ